MLFSRQVIEVVAGFLDGHRVPLVVDPVLVASSGARLLEEDAVELLVTRLFPLATVVTPNLLEARVLCAESSQATRAELAERLVALGARAAIVTGGHGNPIDHLFDGTDHLEIPVERLDVRATHGAGCTQLGDSDRVARARLFPRRRGARRGRRSDRSGAAWPRRARRR